MTTEVRLFAAAAAAAGVTTTPSDAATLTALQRSLLDAFPALAPVLPRCSFLIDGGVAHGDADLTGVATVDVLPPFAGG
ncbi:MAG: MoaD/ThiS family protein [Mycobacteriales bacterium]